MRRAFVTLALFVSVSLTIANSLRCWTCSNARSLDDCLKQGHPETCQRGQPMVCATEIRYHNGFRGQPRIIKRCKQSQACENGKRQNKSDCRRHGRNSVCRCCCNTDECNKINFWCPLGANTAGRASRCRVNPRTPLNGEMECAYKRFLGEINSSCMFLCNDGYVLNGNDISTCSRRSSNANPTFNPAPTCEPEEEAATTESTLSASPTTGVTHREELTQPISQAPKENHCAVIPPGPQLGGRSCINIENGIVCTYFCPTGEQLIGSASITCTNDTGWSTEPPQCGHHCEAIRSGPTNGGRKCVGSGGVGTYCDFSCDPGYELVGNTRLQCISSIDKPVWDKRIPFCRIDIPR